MLLNGRQLWICRSFTDQMLCCQVGDSTYLHASTSIFIKMYFILIQSFIIFRPKISLFPSHFNLFFFFFKQISTHRFDTLNYHEIIRFEDLIERIEYSWKKKIIKTMRSNSWNLLSHDIKKCRVNFKGCNRKAEKKYKILTNIKFFKKKKVLKSWYNDPLARWRNRKIVTDVILRRLRFQSSKGDMVTLFPNTTTSRPTYFQLLQQQPMLQPITIIRQKDVAPGFETIVPRPRVSCFNRAPLVLVALRRDEILLWEFPDLFLIVRVTLERIAFLAVCKCTSFQRINLPAALLFLNTIIIGPTSFHLSSCSQLISSKFISIRDSNHL